MSKTYPTPSFPLKAHHRFLRKVIDVSLPNKVEHRMSEYELINRVFQEAGGSWEEIFLGDIDHISLLKKIVKVAFKKNFFTRRDTWAD